MNTGRAGETPPRRCFWKEPMEYQTIIHPFEPVFDAKCRMLILGSLPSVKSRQNDFYYGHPQNRFWRVLAAVLGEPVPRTIADKKRLQDTLKKLDAEEVVLKLRRDSGYLDVKIKPVRNKKNQYMLGIWVRDNAQGLGTVTFLNTDSRFGALGHGIHDTDTNTLMEIKDGRVYETSIRSIQKGAGGEPGGIEGIIVYNRYNVLGTIDKNTDCGIFGTLERTDNLFRNTEPVGIMATDEIKKGDAVIRCCVEGKVKEYKIRITKTDKHTKEENKGLEIKVTDPELLEITGGIIQGMSGAPILQNGKIAGAVTHVFVNDPARGYGIFIENMLKHVE